MKNLIIKIIKTIKWRFKKIFMLPLRNKDLQLVNITNDNIGLYLYFEFTNHKSKKDIKELLFGIYDCLITTYRFREFGEFKVISVYAVINNEDHLFHPFLVFTRRTDFIEYYDSAKKHAELHFNSTILKDKYGIEVIPEFKVQVMNLEYFTPTIKINSDDDEDES
jgi:hypothetical protein